MIIVISQEVIMPGKSSNLTKYKQKILSMDVEEFVKWFRPETHLPCTGCPAAKYHDKHKEMRCEEAFKGWLNSESDGENDNQLGRIVKG